MVVYSVIDTARGFLSKLDDGTSPSSIAKLSVRQWFHYRVVCFTPNKNFGSSLARNLASGFESTNPTTTFLGTSRHSPAPVRTPQCRGQVSNYFGQHGRRPSTDSGKIGHRLGRSKCLNARASQQKGYNTCNISKKNILKHAL